MHCFTIVCKLFSNNFFIVCLCFTSSVSVHGVGAEEFGRSSAADNSWRKWCWVLRVVEDWRKARNEAVLREPCLGQPVYHEPLSSMSDEELDDVLGKFVAEVRKEGQEEYPEKTLYEMIS